MIRRSGKIYVTKVFIDDPVVALALSDIKFVPFRVEYIFHKDCFEMIGTSERFDEVQEGAEPLEYSLEITTCEHGDFESADAVKYMPSSGPLKF